MMTNLDTFSLLLATGSVGALVACVAAVAQLLHAPGHTARTKSTPEKQADSSEELHEAVRRAVAADCVPPIEQVQRVAPVKMGLQIVGQRGGQAAACTVTLDSVHDRITRVASDYASRAEMRYALERARIGWTREGSVALLGFGGIAMVVACTAVASGTTAVGVGFGCFALALEFGASATVVKMNRANRRLESRLRESSRAREVLALMELVQAIESQACKRRLMAKMVQELLEEEEAASPKTPPRLRSGPGGSPASPEDPRTFAISLPSIKPAKEHA